MPCNFPDSRCAIVLATLGLLMASTGLVAATFTVNTTADVPAANAGDGTCQTTGAVGECSLRAAVQEANALGGEHTIQLPAGSYVLTLIDPGSINAAAGDLTSTSQLTIVGAGSGQTIIDGNHQTRVFAVSSGSLSLIDLTVRNGSAETGQQHLGGAILVDAQLSLNRVILANNVANSGGAIRVSDGASLEVLASTFVGNQALNLGFTNTQGAAIRGNNAASIRIEGSTFTGNQPVFAPGVVEVISLAQGELKVINSTFSGNQTRAIGTNNVNAAVRFSTFADNVEGHLRHFSFDGSQVFNVTASAFQGNLGSSCSGSPPPLSLGFNVLSDASCEFTQTADLQNTSPGLEPLAAIGGATLTHRPLESSPLVNRVPPAQCLDLEGLALTRDQRGAARPAGSHCDSGAVEFGADRLFADRFEP